MFCQVSWTPAAAQVPRVAIMRPQRILVLAPMYHINAFATLHSMLTVDAYWLVSSWSGGLSR